MFQVKAYTHFKVISCLGVISPRNHSDIHYACKMGGFILRITGAILFNLLSYSESLVCL